MKIIFLLIICCLTQFCYAEKEDSQETNLSSYNTRTAKITGNKQVQILEILLSLLSRYKKQDNKQAHNHNK